MAASVKTVRNLGTTNRLVGLRLQLVAGEMAQQIGQRIRVRRLALGLNQRELANLINDQQPGGAVDNQRISDWERGVNKPSERYMRAIADVLSRDLAWFYGREPVEETPDLLTIAARADQVDGGFEEFRGHVAGLEKRLDRIEESIADARREREEQATEVRRLLKEQSDLLDMIREIVAGLGVPDGTTIQDHLAQLVRDTSVRDADAVARRQAKS